MFQNISQGAIIYLLYKNEPRVAEGRVVAVNTHVPVYNPNQPMALLNGLVTDLTLQVGNDTIPFAGLPANGVVANFPDKGLFLAMDKDSVVREVGSLLSASKQVLEQVPLHQKIVDGCDALLLELQPEKQKEVQQAKEIESLKTQLTDMSGKFDRLVDMLSAKLGTQN